LSGELVAGPIVQTILVRRRLRSVIMMLVPSRFSCSPRPLRRAERHTPRGRA